MQLNVIALPQTNSNNSSEFVGSNVVVLDVLRASSTIVTALGNQAFEVIPVLEPAEAMALVRSIGARECLTGGERKGLKIEGFELGNSPLEYSQAKVKDKIIVYSTTNGTPAIKWAQTAAEVLIGCYLNLQTVVDHLAHSTRDVVLICAGRGINVSLEDLACAGMIIQSLQLVRNDLELKDGAQLAQYASERTLPHGLEPFLRQTDHGRYLIEIGMEPDIIACAALNSVPILPRLVEGKIRV